MNAPAFWTARSPRERAVIGWVRRGRRGRCSSFAFVWLPLERDRTRLAAALPQLRASVAEMRAQADEARALRAMPARAPGAATPLASLVASGTLAQGLPGARLTALDGSACALAVDDASWTRLVEWLAAAQATHGLAVAEATVDALPAVGTRARRPRAGRALSARRPSP